VGEPIAIGRDYRGDLVPLFGVAITFALDAIDYAEAAVLDATIARADAASFR
jgi:hypothetical protein